MDIFQTTGMCIPLYFLIIVICVRFDFSLTSFSIIANATTQFTEIAKTAKASRFLRITRVIYVPPLTVPNAIGSKNVQNFQSFEKYQATPMLL